MAPHRRDQLPGLRVAVAGVVRDGEPYLRRDIAALRKATAVFAETRFIVIESDSGDDTLGVLAELRRTVPNFEFESLGKLAPKHPEITDRIAQNRNRYLEILRERHRDLDYVIVADLDDCNSDLTPAGLLSCWDLDVPWDVCTANRQRGYYDIWALRHPLWCPVDCWEQARELKQIVGERAAVELAVTARRIRIDPALPPIEVESAFGGLGVYRYGMITAGRYDGWSGRRRVCEHVPFHAAIRARQGRIFINPAMLNASRGIWELSSSRRKVFGRIYQRKEWGGDETTDFHSGRGSHHPPVVATYVDAVRRFLERFPSPPDAVDLGCGDFFVGSQIRPFCGRYVACDLLPELIERNRTTFPTSDVDFRVVDGVSDPLPNGDVIFIRQVIQHLSNDEIGAIVRKLAKYRYAVITEHVPSKRFRPNVDKPTSSGNRLHLRSGVVLTEPPFNFEVQSAEQLCEIEDEGATIRTIAYRIR